jgi:hypothetical protein
LVCAKGKRPQLCWQGSLGVVAPAFIDAGKRKPGLVAQAFIDARKKKLGLVARFIDSGKKRKKLVS